MGLITAAAIAGAAAIGSGVLASQDKKKAQNQNNAAIEAANAEAMRRYRESRGEGGANAIYPYYLPPGTEQAMAGQAVKVYDAVTGRPVQMTLQEYNDILAQAQPALLAGDKVIQDIYTGELERQRMAQEAPVLAARTALAESQRQGLDTGLQDRLNAITAAEAAKGYLGAGSFLQNRLLASTINARQQAGAVQAAANLENEMAKRNIAAQATDLKLRSLSLPGQRVQERIGLSQAPAAGLVNLNQLGLSALNNFRLGVGNPPMPQRQQFQEIPSLGTIGLSGLSQAAGLYGQVEAQNQLANQYLTNMNANAMMAGGYRVPADFSSWDPGLQRAYGQAIYQGVIPKPPGAGVNW